MTLENLTNQFSILFVLKLMIIIGLVLYTFFAFLISKQIKVMNKAISTQHGHTLHFLGFIHFLTALIILALAIIIL